MESVSGGQTWYKLDNAAKIYPAIKTASWNPMFRLSVTLTEPVDPDRLQKALEITVKRFPNAALRLRAGAFWYYFDENMGAPQIQRDVANPCVRIKFRENGHFLFRVRYYANRIAVEFFHAMTDGTGGLIFLKTLAAQYLRLGGAEIPAEEGVLDCLENPVPEEMEDGYERFADLKYAGKRREKAAWHVKGTKLGSHMLRVTTGIIPTDRVVEAAKRRGVSVTEFLTAVYIFAMHRYQLRADPFARRPIKVSVPVNMRAFYPTPSLRNFSLFVNVGIDIALGVFSLEEIISDVHHQLRRGLGKKYLNAMMAANVQSEKHMMLRICPLFIKNLGLMVAYQALGERQFSTTLSNLGVVRIPEAMAPYAKRFDFLIGKPRRPGIACGVASLNNTMTISFTANIAETDIEREFFTALVKLGIPVKLESNL
jgi:NRPS condensation-like uncharacterized protein